ncbi:MAG: ATP-binding protein [Gemmatimonadota bacterium]
MPHSKRIRFRLTAWYAATALTLLSGAVLAMRQVAIRETTREHEARVDQTVRLVRLFFNGEMVQFGKVDVTVAHMSAELVLPHMVVEFHLPDGRRFSELRQPSGGVDLPEPIRVIEAPLDRSAAPGWKMRMRMSDADLRNALANIDRASLVSIPFVLVASTLAAWLVTGRALRPVAEMALAAEKIVATSSAGRLPIADPNDEFGRLGTRFNAVLDRLDKALHQQRAFLADAAHELRTPIARMLSATEARLAAPEPRSDRSTLTEVREDLGRASRLIDELLQLARADSGGRATLVPGHLDDVVADSMVAWQQEARRRTIELTLDHLDESPMLLDARLIDRLVSILIENAVRYTPGGGRVGVSVVVAATDTFLAIEDSGVGIPLEERERVFDRFYRGVLARQMEPEGNGLGLAIARWIAAEHGGAITVGDSARGGTRFMVRFVTRAGRVNEALRQPVAAGPMRA